MENPGKEYPRPEKGAFVCPFCKEEIPKEKLPIRESKKNTNPFLKAFNMFMITALFASIAFVIYDLSIKGIIPSNSLGSYFGCGAFFYLLALVGISLNR